MYMYYVTKGLYKCNLYSAKFISYSSTQVLIRSTWGKLLN